MRRRRQPTRGERIHKAAALGTRESNDEERTIVHCITKRIVDRDGDVIEPRGGRLENYRKNPVVLFGHEWWSMPIGRNLALDVSDEEILALTQFAGLDQASDEAERCYRLIRDGFLPATSIGFMPITWSDDTALAGQDGWWFKEWELFEYSIVSVPSNPEALMRMLKAYGLPPGATEKDLKDALKRDRQPYWDVAASLAGGAATRGVSPSDVSPEKADQNTDWSAPALQDFTSEPWGDLSGADRRRIAGHYAWAAMIPPEAFGELKLPHHRPSDGAIVLRGVVNAAARLSQSDLPDADLGDVQAHLGRHYRAFDRTPPWDENAEAWSAYLAAGRALAKTRRSTISDLASLLSAFGFVEDAAELRRACDCESAPALTGVGALRLVAALLLKQDGTDIQSVICSKETFDSAEAAARWCREHNLKAADVDETAESYRFRQFPPGECQEGALDNDQTFATIELAEGVQAVICKRTAETAGSTLTRSLDRVIDRLDMIAERFAGARPSAIEVRTKADVKAVLAELATNGR